MHDPTPTPAPGDPAGAAPAEPTPPTWTPAAGATEITEPVAAPPAAEAGPARRSRGRTIAAATVGGAIVVGALTLAVVAGSRPDSAPAPAGDAAKIEAPAADGRDGRLSEAAWTSPDGQTRVHLEGRGGGGMEGIGASDITITAISGTKLSLETDNGWTRTIDAAGATITKGGETVQASALAVGDQVRFRETQNDDGTYTVTAIAVVQPSVKGTVASVSDSTVTVTTRDGGTSKVVLTGSTTYEIGGQAATKDAVVAGARILATGTLAADGTLTATSVEIAPATAAGTVKEKSSGSITLTTRDGSTLVVKVTSSTTYQVEGVTAPTLADINVGDVVMAGGTKNSDGSLTATVVRAHAAGTFGGPGGGRGWGGDGGPGRGPGGFPGWGGPGDDDAAAPSSAPSGGTNG